MAQRPKRTAGNSGRSRRSAGNSGRGPRDGVALAAHDLTKRYGARTALDSVSLEAKRGELLAVIGPNGAGKTTLLSILAGVVDADSGEVSRPAGEVGWVPQQTAVYGRLTVEENLRLFARLERVADIEATVKRMLGQAGLRDRRGDQLATLSGGNQQRVNVAVGVLGMPAVLLLDEPSAGLDPRQRERLWKFVSGLAERGTTVIFTTHDIREAEHHGERLLVLADGEQVFEGTSGQLRRATAASRSKRSHARKGAKPTRDDLESAFVAFLADRGH